MVEIVFFIHFEGMYEPQKHGKENSKVEPTKPL